MKISKQLKDRMDSTEIPVNRNIKKKIEEISNANKDKTNFFSKKERLIFYLIVQGLKANSDLSAFRNKTKGEIMETIESELEKNAANEKLISLTKLNNVYEDLIFRIGILIVQDPEIFIETEDLAKVLGYLLDRGFREVEEQIETTNVSDFLYEEIKANF
jgi:hypothetical protein